jgi:hypothetical protein
MKVTWLITTEKHSVWNVKSEIDSRCNGNRIKVIYTMHEKHTGKARNHGTAENSYIGHCGHTSLGTNVKVQNIQNGK